MRSLRPTACSQMPTPHPRNDLGIQPDSPTPAGDNGSERMDTDNVLDEAYESLHAINTGEADRLPEDTDDEEPQGGGIPVPKEMDEIAQRYTMMKHAAQSFQRKVGRRDRLIRDLRSQLREPGNRPEIRLLIAGDTELPAAAGAGDRLSVQQEVETLRKEVASLREELTTARGEADEWEKIAVQAIAKVAQVPSPRQESPAGSHRSQAKLQILARLLVSTSAVDNDIANLRNRLSSR